MTSTTVKIIQVAPSLLETANTLPIPDDLDVKIRTKSVIDELYPSGVNLPPTSEHMTRYDTRINNFTYYMSSTLNHIKSDDTLIIAFDFNIQKRGHPIYPSISLIVENASDRMNITFKTHGTQNTGQIDRDIIITPEIQSLLKSIDSIHMRLPPNITLGPRRKLTPDDILLFDHLTNIDGEKLRSPVFIGTDIEFRAFLDTFELDIYRSNSKQTINTGLSPIPPVIMRGGGGSAGARTTSTKDKHRIGVVFPFREQRGKNRFSHLAHNLEHTIGFLEKLSTKHNFEWTIIISEQANIAVDQRIEPFNPIIHQVIDETHWMQKFNLGAARNVGFIEAEKRGCDYVILHDADLLVEGDELQEKYVEKSDKIQHIAHSWDRYNSDGKTNTYLGGIIKFPIAKYREINGSPNDFFGWGGDDDELLARINRKNMQTHIEYIKVKGKNRIVDLEEMTLTDKLAEIANNRIDFKNFIKTPLLIQNENTWTENGLNQEAIQFYTRSESTTLGTLPLMKEHTGFYDIIFQATAGAVTRIIARYMPIIYPHIERELLEGIQFKSRGPRISMRLDYFIKENMDQFDPDYIKYSETFEYLYPNISAKAVHKLIVDIVNKKHARINLYNLLMTIPPLPLQTCEEYLYNVSDFINQSDIISLIKLFNVGWIGCVHVPYSQDKISEMRVSDLESINVKFPSVRVEHRSMTNLKVGNLVTLNLAGVITDFAPTMIQKLTLSRDFFWIIEAIFWGRQAIQIRNLRGTEYFVVGMQVVDAIVEYGDEQSLMTIDQKWQYQKLGYMFPIFMELRVKVEKGLDIIIMEQKPEKLYTYLDSDTTDIFVHLDSDKIPPGPLYVGRSRLTGHTFHLLLQIKNNEMEWQLFEYDAKNSNNIISSRHIRWFADKIHENTDLPRRVHDLDNEYIVPMIAGATTNNHDNDNKKPIKDRKRNNPPPPRKIIIDAKTDDDNLDHDHHYKPEDFPIPHAWHVGERKLRLQPYTGVIRTVHKKILADIAEIANIIINQMNQLSNNAKSRLKLDNIPEKLHYLYPEFQPLRELVDNGNLTLDNFIAPPTNIANISIFTHAIDFIHDHLALMRDAEVAEKAGHDSELSHIIENSDDEMQILFEFLLNKLDSVTNALKISPRNITDIKKRAAHYDMLDNETADEFVQLLYQTYLEKIRDKSERVKRELERAREMNYEERKDIIHYEGDFDTANIPVREYHNQDVCVINTAGDYSSNEKYPGIGSYYPVAADKEQVTEFIIQRHRKSLAKKSDKLGTPTATNIFYRKKNLLKTITNNVTEKLKHRFFANINGESFMNTLHYMFFHINSGTYVRYRNGKLDSYIPFYNIHYRNNWKEYDMKFVNSGMYPGGIGLPPKRGEHAPTQGSYYEDRARYVAARVRGFRRKMVAHFPLWSANNCIIRSEADDENIHASFVVESKHLLQTLGNEREIPDCEFFLHRRDFPILKADSTEPYHHIYDSYKMPLRYYKYRKYTPILGFTTAPGFLDIPIPTPDDWLQVQRNFLEIDCGGGGAANANIKQISWDKRKSTAVFRGSATGCGTTIHNNQRLKLAALSVEWTTDSKKRGIDGELLLNAGITSWAPRDRKMYGDVMRFIRPSVAGIEHEDTIPFQLASKLSYDDQANYKYVIYVDGNSAAYRYLSLMKMGSVILKVASLEGYQMWYYPLLVDGVDHIAVKADLSDLEEKIRWCINHDDECRRIVANARALHDKILNRDGMLDYLEMILINMKDNEGRENDISIKTPSDPLWVFSEQTNEDTLPRNRMRREQKWEERRAIVKRDDHIDKNEFNFDSSSHNNSIDNEIQTVSQPITEIQHESITTQKIKKTQKNTTEFNFDLSENDEESPKPLRKKQETKSETKSENENETDVIIPKKPRATKKQEIKSENEEESDVIIPKKPRATKKQETKSENENESENETDVIIPKKPRVVRKKTVSGESENEEVVPSLSQPKVKNKKKLGNAVSLSDSIEQPATPTVIQSTKSQKNKKSKGTTSSLLSIMKSDPHYYQAAGAWDFQVQIETQYMKI